MDADATGSTELNIDQDPLVKPETTANPNVILIWLVGGIILLLIGTGLWVAAQAFLERARPEVDSTSMDSVIEEGHLHREV